MLSPKHLYKSFELLVLNHYVCFQMRGKEYSTPLDLWKSKYEGEVTATQNVKSPQGYQTRIQPIHQMDRVQLVDLNQVDLQKVMSDDKQEEREVVEVRRVFSQFNDPLGMICLDSDAKACFEEPPPIIGQHGISDLLRYGKIPMEIALGEISQMHSVTEGDRILLCESPFKVLQECTYSVTYVRAIEMRGRQPIGDISEIPDCYNIKVRSSKVHKRGKPTSQPEKPKSEPESPKSGLFTLSSTEYYLLIGQPDYMEIIDDRATVAAPICHTYFSFKGNVSTLQPAPTCPINPVVREVTPPPLPPGSVNRESYQHRPRADPILQFPGILDQSQSDRLTPTDQADTNALYVPPARPPKSPNLSKRSSTRTPPSSPSKSSFRPVPRPR